MGETVLGNRYEIIKKIGDGGMAFVYEAKDRLLNRTVAVKVLRPELVDDEEFLGKFKREAEAVASLSHPNIVNVYDVGSDGKVHYIVMELVEGQNLKDIIKNEGTLDEYTALDIAKQIARALGAAHKKGIVHRDIKPHNILIANEGRIVKVADFGIAKAVSSSTMTSTGSIIGSVHYFSPEQAKGKFVGNTTDLYSLGIVLYEMIIGRVPFRGDSPISIALQHINDEIEFTQEEKVAIPQSVRNIIKKLTSKSSDDRYQGADELIEDIEYIEKNIDLDFIKEYDNYATKKIDEAELNNAINQKIHKNSMDEEEIEEDIIEEKPRKSSNKKNKKAKKEDSPKAKKILKVAAVFLSLILIVQVILVGKLFLFGNSNKLEEGIAPDLRSMSLSEAQETARDLGLDVRVRIEEYSSSIPKNHIISQQPGVGAQVNKGDIISVVISKGENIETIPNVEKLTLSEAVSILDGKNIVYNIKYEYSDIHAKDIVLSQSPNSGSIEGVGKVQLIVSKGPKVEEPEVPVVPEEPPAPEVTPPPTTPELPPVTPEVTPPQPPVTDSGNQGGTDTGTGTPGTDGAPQDPSVQNTTQ